MILTLLYSAFHLLDRIYRIHMMDALRGDSILFTVLILSIV